MGLLFQPKNEHEEEVDKLTTLDDQVTLAPGESFGFDGGMNDSSSLEDSFFHEEDEEEAIATRSAPRRNNKRLLVGGLVLVGVVLLVSASIVVGLSWGRGQENSAMTAQIEKEHEVSENLHGPSERSDHEIRTHLLGVLMQHTPKETLLNLSTPQGQAFSSLVEFEQSTLWPTIEFRVIQRYAMLTLYYATDGPTGWDLVPWNVMESYECSWPGVLECKDNGAGEQAVTNLFLVSNNLKGPIPSELCLLEHLENLDLANNLLAGTIPTCLMTSSLQHLVLRKNLLTGTLPPGGGTSELLTLDVSHNRLTGSVGELLPAKLQKLHLNDNGFTGKIPTWEHQPADLTSLTLTGNQLTGMVPFCGLTELTADCDEVLCNCCTNCGV